VDIQVEVDLESPVVEDMSVCSCLHLTVESHKSLDSMLFFFVN